MCECFLTTRGLCVCRCVPRSESHADWDCNPVICVKLSISMVVFLICFDKYD